MKQNKILALLLLLVVLPSCYRHRAGSDSMMLEKTGRTLAFPLDSYTKLPAWALFPYTDMDGKEYLTFQNERRNEILFYEMDSGTLLYKLQPALEGPDGVGRFFGYYIQDLRHIYLTSFKPGITLVDQNANVQERISCSQTADSIPLNAFYALSHRYQPITVIGNRMYIISGCNRLAEKNPVSAVIDMETKTIEALPFEYPIFPVSDDKRKTFSIENDMSRCYDGTHFVYSFHYDENIYVALPDHQNVRRIPVKSRYISKIGFTERQTPRELMRNECENPQYGNLLYDPYRNVYYRLVYPKTELEPNENYVEHYAYGRKTFSIIILDKDFNIVGETLFPDFVYICTMMFVREDGLYISTNHFKNPGFDEDKLSFTCFELKKLRPA